MSIFERVAAFAAERRLLQDVEQVVVGFSGGPDSTALLLVMRELAPKIVAVHLDHGLRDGATADAEWCAAFCRERGIAFRLEALETPRHQAAGESMEMAARRLRLACWQRLVAEMPGTVVALGHHLDDAVETFFQRLMRGSNASGLTGLRARRVVEGVVLIRPLLCLERPELEAWLAEQGIVPRQDPTNRDTSIQRNAIRHRLLPVLRELGGLEAIGASLDYLQQDAELLESLMPAEAELTVEGLRELPETLLPRVLRRWQLQQTGEDRPIRGSRIEALASVLAQGAGEVVRLDWDADRYLVLERGRLALLPKEPPELPEPLRWAWREEPVLKVEALGICLRARVLPALPGDAWEDAARCYWPVDALPDLLLVRGRLPGDRLTPYGTNRAVRVKKLVGDAKVELAQKRRLVVVGDPSGDRLFWLAPVRRSAYAPILDPQSPVLELSYERVDPLFE